MMFNENPKKTTFQGRLSQIIRDNCRSKKDFAERIDISADTIKTWDDAHLPKGDTLLKIRQVFRVNLNWLLAGEEEPYSQAKTKVAEDNGLYALTRDDPQETAKPDDLSTIDRLVEMLSRRDSENSLLKARNQELEKRLRSIQHLVADHRRKPHEERRAVMKAISDLFDGNELLKRR